MREINKKNIKKVLIFICICLILFMIHKIVDIYAVFQSEAIGNVEFKNGAWNVYINGTDITKGVMVDFVINQINTEENEHTLPGKLAPGGTGDFEILIDPKDTAVSIKYDVSINTESITNKNVNIISINETEIGNELIRTGENTYTGVISLSEIEAGKTNKINVEIEWTDDGTNDEQDTKLGIVANNKLDIPIIIKASQYLGEQIEEYVEPPEEPPENQEETT